MTPLIRLATPADAPAIAALVDLAYAKWVPLIGRNPTPMDVDYAQAVHEHRFDLIEEAGRLIALFETTPRDDHYYFVNLAVHPDAQGRGLGSLLFRHAESVAQSLGFSVIKLDTNKMFEANIRLYTALGYTIEREEPFRGGTVVFMTKDLRKAL